MSDTQAEIDYIQLTLLAHAMEKGSGPMLGLRRQWEHQKALLNARFDESHHHANQLSDVLDELIKSTERCRQLQQKAAALALLAIDEGCGG